MELTPLREAMPVSIEDKLKALDHETLVGLVLRVTMKILDKSAKYLTFNRVIGVMRLKSG